MNTENFGRKDITIQNNKTMAIVGRIISETGGKKLEAKIWRDLPRGWYNISEDDKEEFLLFYPGSDIKEINYAVIEQQDKSKEYEKNTKAFKQRILDIYEAKKHQSPLGWTYDFDQKYSKEKDPVYKGGMFLGKEATYRGDGSIIFNVQQTAYKYMWKFTAIFKLEILFFISDNIVFSIPYYLNGDSDADYHAYGYYTEKKDPEKEDSASSILFNKKDTPLNLSILSPTINYNIVGTMHTHPNIRASIGIAAPSTEDKITFTKNTPYKAFLIMSIVISREKDLEATNEEYNNINLWSIRGGIGYRKIEKKEIQVHYKELSSLLNGMKVNDIIGKNYDLRKMIKNKLNNKGKESDYRKIMTYTL